ncbi:MAG: hypothetical protein ACYC8T_25705, partial [Myxococcaceae bacterium]
MEIIAASEPRRRGGVLGASIQGKALMVEPSVFRKLAGLSIHTYVDLRSFIDDFPESLAGAMEWIDEQLSSARAEL